MSSANGKKSLALLAAGMLGSTAITASAAPFLTVSLVGRVQGSGDPFTSSVVVGAGDVVEYEIRTQLGAEEAYNPYAGSTATGLSNTISNWIPSNGGTAPTSGLNQVRFHLSGSTTSGDMSVNFAAPANLATGWADASGFSGGTPSGDSLLGVNAIRAPGNFDGVAGTPVANGEADPVPAVLEVLSVASGTFTIDAGGNASVVQPTFTGGAFTTSTVLATLRSRNDANTANVNYNPIVSQQTNSVNGTAQGGNAVDPIIVYQGLALVPEPATISLLGLAGVGMLARRRRQA